MEAEKFINEKTIRVVIKIGSTLLTNDGCSLNLDGIRNWVEQISALHRRDVQTVLVSSGSIAAGMNSIGLSSKPTNLRHLQALAAVGQMGLTQAYRESFSKHNIKTGQVLLTHDDFADANRYENARHTLNTLLDWNVVPIINENDTVATEGLRLSDNDTLAALTVEMIEASRFIILTDQPGVLESDPNINANADVVRMVDADNPRLLKIAGGSTSLGKGGMITKIKAARSVARIGISTNIVNGRAEDIISRTFFGEQVGTFLRARLKSSASIKDEESYRAWN